MLKSIAQVKTFVEVANAESTAHILSNRGRNMRPLLTFVIMKFFFLTSWMIFSAFPCDTFTLNPAHFILAAASLNISQPVYMSG